MLSTFPEFQKVTLASSEDFKQFTTKHSPSSDYNFAGLWSYNTEEDIIVSNLNGNLAVRFSDYITSEHFYSLLGETKLVESVETLLTYAKKQGVMQELKLIPETVINSEPQLGKLYTIVEDTDNQDYIISTYEISEMVGQKHHSKAALTRQFNRLYPFTISTVLDLDLPETHTHIYELFDVWEKAKNKKREDTKHELIALKRLIDDRNAFNLTSVGLFHEGKLISFALTEIVHDKYAIIHFMKTDPVYKGVTEATHQFHARHLKSKDVDFLNMEQDMGIEGLRNAKLQWHPVHFIKKYKILPK